MASSALAAASCSESEGITCTPTAMRDLRRPRCVSAAAAASSSAQDSASQRVCIFFHRLQKEYPANYYLRLLGSNMLPIDL
ncbi:hypothetical protein ZWY2020_031930 [Hordeum vulgare]|nr:hypothetical protein ZWY2020_031930 [Hordeum vulgare]